MNKTTLSQEWADDLFKVALRLNLARDLFLTAYNLGT